MTSVIQIHHSEDVGVSGRIIYLVGERQPEQLTQLLGRCLSEPQVERVVLVASSPATASRIAAPYAAQREEGRLATVLVQSDVASAIRAARRGWGEPDLVISAGSAAGLEPGMFAPATALRAIA